MWPRRSGGFTLIELLVVIAIIGILTAMLFPVYSRVRAKARQTTCISNVRQITMAFLMYAEDHDGRLPPATGVWPGVTYWGDASWLAFVQPYIRNKPIYLCPEAPGSEPDWTKSADSLASYGFAPSFATQGNYYASWVTTFNGTALMEGLGGFYSAYGPMGWYKQEADSRRLGDVARPSDMIMLMDHWGWDWGWAWGYFYYPSPRHLPERNASGLEMGFVDCGFVDGHAKALKHSAVWQIEKGMNTPWGARDVYFHLWPHS